MLLEFNFENVYSYRDEAYFSMEAVPRTRIINEFNQFRKHRILKSAIIFGANASGKSNLFSALKLFNTIVVKQDNQKLFFPSFAGKTENPIFLSVTIKKEDEIYKYSLSYTKQAIKEEKLEIEQKDGSFSPYFHREGNDYPVLPEELEILKSKTRSDNLFLNTAKTFNDTHSLNVYRWFIEDLLIFDSQFEVSPDILKKLKNKRNSERVIKFLQAADISIQDFKIIEQPVNTEVLPEELRRFLMAAKIEPPKYEIRLRFVHKLYNQEEKHIGEFELDLHEESDGTRRALYLALILLLNKDKVILIDEFDDSLHVELAQALLEVFNSENNSNQFILTSHELSLMDARFKREQIYFVERQFNGVSDVYSIYDFNSRQDYGLQKRYSDGQFGAVPVILVDALKETLDDKHANNAVKTVVEGRN